MPAPAKDPAVMQAERDPRRLLATACAYAASDQVVDHELLLRYLGSAQFLHRLNEPRQYLYSRPRSLNVARIVKTLMTSPHPIGRRSLLALLHATDFISYELLQELMVRALAVIRPAPPDAIAFWDFHSKADSDNLHLVIEALFANRSAPAMELFERKLADLEQEPDDKVLWLHDQLLRARNDPEVLRLCGRITTRSNLPGTLKLTVIETLCSYDRDWYAGCKKPRPPARSQLGAEGTDLLTRICRHARENFAMKPELEIAVETTLREIGADPEQREGAPP